MAILALIELDCIKMDWKEIIKIISTCNKGINDEGKSSKFNKHMAAKIANQIFQIKISPTFVTYQRLRI